MPSFETLFPVLVSLFSGAIGLLIGGMRMSSRYATTIADLEHRITASETMGEKNLKCLADTGDLVIAHEKGLEGLRERLPEMEKRLHEKLEHQSELSDEKVNGEVKRIEERIQMLHRS